MSEEDVQPEAIGVPIDLSLIDEEPVGWANYFLLQYGVEDGFVLSVCQVRPPALVGSLRDQPEVAANLVIKARPMLRVAVGRAKLLALARLIDRQLERFPESKDIVEADGESTETDAERPDA